MLFTCIFSFKWYIIIEKHWSFIFIVKFQTIYVNFQYLIGKNNIPIVDKIKKELKINIVDNSIQKTIEISSDAIIVIRSVCTDGNPPFTIQVINKNEIIYDSMENDGDNFDSVQEAEKIIQDDMESFLDIMEVDRIK